MSIETRTKAQVLRIMNRFQSVRVELLRPKKNGYGETTEETEVVGACRAWMEGPVKPSKFMLDERGTMAGDDFNAQWMAVIGDEAPEAAHGDLVRLPDGSVRKIRSIYTTMHIRIHWELVKT